MARSSLRAFSGRLGLAPRREVTKAEPVNLCGFGGLHLQCQNRVVPGWLEIFQGKLENRIQPPFCVHYIQINRSELVAEMQLRIVIQGTAHVTAQFLLDRPTNHVAHCVEIKMKVERDFVIEADDFVVKSVAAQ